MSDLTTEQIAEWADNEFCQMVYEAQLEEALDRVAWDINPGDAGRAILHAHARHLRLEQSEADHCREMAHALDNLNAKDSEIDALKAENARLREAAVYLHERTVQLAAGKSVRDLDEAMSAVEQALQGSDE